MLTNKLQKTIVVGLIILVGLAPFLAAPFSRVHAQQRTVAQAIELARTHLLNSQNADGSIGDSSSSDWAAMALAAAATNDSRFTNLKTYITAQASRVDKNSATELERTILALTAIGVTPYNVQNRNLVDELKALAAGGQIGSPNLLNDDIFAILAFRAAGQDPATEPFKNAIEFVKRSQLGSDGFNDRVGGQEADIDITAVAAVALGLYHNTAAAKNLLASAQNSDGGFPSRVGSNSNVASTAWTIWAIGLNQRAVEYLINQQQSNGSFGSIIATSYGLHALTGRSLPVGLVNAPAQQPVGQVQNQQLTQQPANQEQLQQTSGAIIQPILRPIASTQTTPSPTQKPDLLPVATSDVVENAPANTPRVKKIPSSPIQREPQTTNQPLATPAARVNRNSNLLLIAGSHPKETLAQTHFEARTVEPPRLIQSKNSLRNAIPYTLAIGSVTLASIFAIVLLWRSASPSELTAPRLAPS